MMSHILQPQNTLKCFCFHDTFHISIHYLLNIAKTIESLFVHAYSSLQSISLICHAIMYKCSAIKRLFEIHGITESQHVLCVCVFGLSFTLIWLIRIDEWDLVICGETQSTVCRCQRRLYGAKNHSQLFDYKSIKRELQFSTQRQVAIPHCGFGF